MRQRLTSHTKDLSMMCRSEVSILIDDGLIELKVKDKAK